jgi:Uma2 family endonuclease
MSALRKPVVDLLYTIHDLDSFPEDGLLRELIEGELYVSTQPHWHHQYAASQLFRALEDWNQKTGLGIANSAPGVIFSIHDAVAPDVVWVSAARLPNILGDDGKLHDAPDLVVEVISPGWRNETRDRDTKLKLYSRRGVREYWVVDWQARRVEVFRRSRARLMQIVTLLNEDVLTSPLLAGFSCPVAQLFMQMPELPKPAAKA